MVRTHGRSLEAMMPAPAPSVGPPSPAPAFVGRPARLEIGLDAALLEAVTIVLLQNCTPRLVVREAEATGNGAIQREPATAREARGNDLERRLAERGGWDEV